MITIGEDVQLKIASMGLFDTDAEWIHPVITIETYELIFVLSGEIKIYEGERNFIVSPGQMLLLEPGIEHGGFAHNVGHTSFYWLHFYTNRISEWQMKKQCTMPPQTEKIFRELIHLFHVHKDLSEVTLAKFLMENRLNSEYKNKLAYEIREFIRIHVRENLRVDALARQFGYSPDHLSRLYKQEFGLDLKEAITRQRLLDIESLLLNTDATIKEIAMMSGFEDENIFVKFFKYHEGITPRTYRNRFFHIHMNNH